MGMSRLVNCIKLKEKAEGLDRQPFPGKNGLYIFENVSKQAWQEWLSHQTILINEHRLTPFEPDAKHFLEQERQKFFSAEGTIMPEGYVPPAS